MLTVDTYKMLKALPNHTEGEIAYVTKEEQTYQYTENGWQVIPKPKGGLNMSLYDINKQIMAQQPNMEDFESSFKLLTDFHTSKGNKYYMLLFKDLNYYTIFHTNDDKTLLMFEIEVINCLRDTFKNVKSITENFDGEAIECWIETFDGEVVVGYLFGYDGGVIECQ